MFDRSSFSDFASKYGKDDRFKGIEKMRERESLFTDFVSDVRRREKEEKSSQREKVGNTSNSHGMDFIVENWLAVNRLTVVILFLSPFFFLVFFLGQAVKELNDVNEHSNVNSASISITSLCSCILDT